MKPDDRRTDQQRTRFIKPNELSFCLISEKNIIKSQQAYIEQQWYRTVMELSQLKPRFAYDTWHVQISIVLYKNKKHSYRIAVLRGCWRTTAPLRAKINLKRMIWNHLHVLSEQLCSVYEIKCPIRCFSFTYFVEFTPGKVHSVIKSLRSMALAVPMVIRRCCSSK